MKATTDIPAIVAEVEVDQDTGKIAVKRIVVAIDAGPISNPDGLRNQIEGGALQGMSRALLEEVTWDDQKVTSVDWRTYHSLPLGFPYSQGRMRAVEPAGRRSDGRGRDFHYGDRGRHRQRDFRRHRRAPAPDPVHAGARQSSAQRAGLSHLYLSQCVVISWTTVLPTRQADSSAGK